MIEIFDCSVRAYYISFSVACLPKRFISYLNNKKGSDEWLIISVFNYAIPIVEIM